MQMFRDYHYVFDTVVVCGIIWDGWMKGAREGATLHSPFLPLPLAPPPPCLARSQGGSRGTGEEQRRVEEEWGWRWIRPEIQGQGWTLRSRAPGARSPGGISRQQSAWGWDWDGWSLNAAEPAAMAHRTHDSHPVLSRLRTSIHEILLFPAEKVQFHVGPTN